MNNRAAEISVGLFILVGMVALLVLALKVSDLTHYSSRQGGYLVTANFDNIGGLKVRAPVKMAGVKVGSVTAITLDLKTYRAIVTIHIDDVADVLPKDSSASIYTAGLLGANYVALSPGFDEVNLHNGDTIENTQSALILEDLIGQFIFKLNKEDKQA